MTTPRSQVCSSAVARPKSVADRRRPRRLRPGARQRRDRARSASCTSRTVSDGVEARAGSDDSPRQPSPVRRCRSAPPTYAVTVSTSSGGATASRAAIAATLALRDRVAATVAEVATTSASSMPPFNPSAPTPGPTH